MVDHMTASLDEIKVAYLEDGIIDNAEVDQLKERIMDDGVVDLDEIKLLVDLADQTDAEKNAPEFAQLYNDCVEARYLKDEASPGSIDKEESDEIIELFWGDGNLNSYEKGALTMIKEKATSIDAGLSEKIEFLGV